MDQINQSQENPSNQEKEKQLTVAEAINIIAEKSKSVARDDVVGYLKNFTTVLNPKTIKELTERASSYAQEEANNTGVEKGFIAGAVAEIMKGMTDRLTGIATQEQYLPIILSDADRIFREILNETSEENKLNLLKKITVSFADVDGLKAINDLSIRKHQAGDDALRKVADILNQEEVRNWLGRQGIEIIPIHKHGDEFMVIFSDQESEEKRGDFLGINKETVTQQSISEYAIEYILKQLKSVDTTNILDFTNKRQRQIIEEKIGTIPEGFKFQLNFSYGSANMEDAIKYLIDQEYDFKENDYWEILSKIGGALIEVSDTRMSADKKARTQNRQQGDEREQYLERLYKIREIVTERGPGRRNSDFENIQRIAGLEEIIKELQNQLRQVRSESQERNP